MLVLGFRLYINSSPEFFRSPGPVSIRTLPVRKVRDFVGNDLPPPLSECPLSALVSPGTRKMDPKIRGPHGVETEKGESQTPVDVDVCLVRVVVEVVAAPGQRRRRETYTEVTCISEDRRSHDPKPPGFVHKAQGRV